MKKTISIVISLYNEAEGVFCFWSALRQEIKKLGAVNFELIWVNDGSMDDTQVRLEKLTAANADENIIHCVIEFSKNFGHESAMIAGIDHAKGDAVICMDADGQHPPAEISKMIHAFCSGNDLVLMERVFRADSSRIKKLLSALFYHMINKLSAIKLRHNATDFFSDIKASCRHPKGQLP